MAGIRQIQMFMRGLAGRPVLLFRGTICLHSTKPVERTDIFFSQQHNLYIFPGYSTIIKSGHEIKSAETKGFEPHLLIAKDQLLQESLRKEKLLNMKLKKCWII